MRRHFIIPEIISEGTFMEVWRYLSFDDGKNFINHEDEADDDLLDP